MDFKAKTWSWLQNVSRKFEDLCVGVGSTLTAQTTFSNLYSEFVEEMLPLISCHSNNHGALDSSVEQASDTTDLTGQEGSNNGIGGDKEGGDWDENSPSKAATDELLVDTPSQQSGDTNLFSRATTDELLVRTPLQQSVDLAMEERPCNLSQIDLKKLNPEAENDLVEEKNLSPETLKFVCPAPSDSLAETSLIPTANFSFSEHHDEFVESEDLLSVANSGRSDHTSAGVAEDDHVTEQVMETIQPIDKELDEIRFIADDKILLSNSVLEAKIAPYQEYIWETVASKFVGKQEYESESFEDVNAEFPQEYESESFEDVNAEFPQEYESESFEDVNAEADYQLREEENMSLTPLLVAQEVKSPDEDSSDSDWEII